MGGGGSPAAVVPAEITEAVSRVDQAVEYVMSVSRVRALGAPLALIVSSLHVKRNVHPSHPGAGAAAEGSEAETILLLAASGVQFPTRPLNHTTEWRVAHSLPTLSSRAADHSDRVARRGLYAEGLNHTRPVIPRQQHDQWRNRSSPHTHPPAPSPLAPIVFCPRRA